MNKIQELNIIDLTFSDFLLLSILLAFLHLINVIEILKTNEKKENVTYSGLKFQATLAFIGIITTVICGVIAQYLKNSWIESSLILFPLLFILAWFINQIRSSKLFIDLDHIHEQTHSIIQNEILSWAERKGEFTMKDLKNEYNTILTVDILMRNFISYFSKNIIPVEGLNQLYKPLQFTEIDIEGILQNLCNSKDLIKVNGGIYKYKNYQSDNLMEE